MTRAQQAVATRTALLEAARRLFVTRGYLNTKINDITAEAGRSAGSFYGHFASKQELLEALLAEVADASEQWSHAGEHSSDFSAAEAVRYHVAVYWNVYREHSGTFLALGQAALVDEEFARVLGDFRRTQFDHLIDHLANVPNLPATPQVTLTMMVAMLERLAQLWPDLPAEDAVESATRFIYRALNARDC